MPPDVAVVELVAPQATPEMAAVLADACSSARATSRCELAASPPAGASHIVARIDVDESTLAFKIAIDPPALDKSGTIERTLRFRPEDAERERWRTVGFVVGSVAEGITLEPPSPRPPDEHREPPAPPKPIERPAIAPVWLDALAILGSALEDGSVRVGASLRAAYAFPRLPLLIGASFRYGVRPADEAGLAIHWIGGSVGLGVHVPLGIEQLRFDARLELVGELMLATVDEPFTGASDATSRWVGGGRLSANLAYMPWRHFGFVGGVDGTVIQSGTVVKIDATTSGRAPPYAFSGNVGVRFAFP